MGSFIFHITAALAELERSIIRERTRARIGSRAWAQRRPAEEAQ
jgi:DNA invertase Pin-like site-specific DNA recombinase